MSKVQLFELPFDNFNYEDLMLYIDSLIQSGESAYIVTCNVDHLIKLKKDEHFRRVYSEAGSIVADGMPIVWASRILRKPLKQRVSGADMLRKLGRSLEERSYRMFFLGASEGVAEKAKQQLLTVFPKLQIVGTHSPSYGFERNEEENERIIKIIREAKPDIVWVGVGAPKQEKWIHNYHRRYGTSVSIGVGAAFDFISGNVKRAPLLVQKLGLEWLWRLFQEPKRLWKRYLIDDMQFLGLLLKEIKKERGRKRYDTQEKATGTEWESEPSHKQRH
ncbi:WecB/TagA/CpsF family glycosyltransferase [Cohnella sp.]|uniref:WecB/TagA/CpsF family glycosyltransferase n=1 Tax=Cohnella sp. TaxID=1883426 RepID=UPI003566DFBA